MIQKKKKVVPLHHKQRLNKIAQMLKEMRFVDGKPQNGYEDCGVSRRQIQRGEHSSNMTLLKLFAILDCFEGYTLNDFFQGME
jgi:hypothetical protein